MNPTSLLLPVALAAMASTPAAAAPITRSCDSVSVTLAGGAHGGAHGIRATGIGCTRARTIVRACLRDDLRGWRVSRAPSPDDRNPKGLVGLDRRSAHVSFQIRGHGGCG
ncbi:MAG TPA: hypothetical protein VNT03_07190 [Baekduia sp.]|nr:hypothetical protein [Baekduia sp.]